jgi:hypothetical protein
VTEADCQRIDEDFGARVQAHRQFLTPKSHESLPSRNLQNSIQSTGTFILVLTLEWRDHAAQNKELILREDLE